MSGIPTAIAAPLAQARAMASAPASAPTSSAATSSAATSSQASAPAAQGVITGMTQDTRQFVIKLFAVAIVVFTGAILAMMLYRAWMDGNAPLTAQITAGLIGLIPWLLGFVAVIITGEPVGTALVYWAIRVFVPGAAALPPLPGLPLPAATSSDTTTTTATPSNG